MSTLKKDIQTFYGLVNPNGAYELFKNGEMFVAYEDDEGHMGQVMG